MSKEIAIVAAARTPIGAFQGALSSLTAPRLGAVAIQAALQRAGLKPEQVEQVFMGCVLQGGVGQAPARQAALYAGLPEKTPCVTVNKVCGSGLESIIEAARVILTGDAEIVVAGGMESMSNAPYFSPAIRGGARMGNIELKDLMIHDGLWDPYNDMHMGMCGEKCATDFSFSRAAQDEYAIESTKRAQKAQAEGAFKAEIAPVTLAEKSGPKTIANDEHPLKVDPARIPGLRPAFRQNGTISPAASSANADGAAALVLARRSLADSMGLPSLAEIKGHATHSHEPQWFTTAPIPAIRKLLDKVGWSVSDVDLFEINEAFAVVAMAAQRDLSIAREKLNINGGACALGHPIGATGARLIVTLLHALEAQNLRRGVAALCIGGGEATAIAVERIIH